MPRQPNTHPDMPHRQDVTVTASRYYRLRADVQRGLKCATSATDGGLDGQSVNSLAGWRMANNLTPAELARDADVTIDEINRIESGSFDVPMITYIKLSGALRINVSMIIGVDKKKIL